MKDGNVGVRGGGVKSVEALQQNEIQRVVTTNLIERGGGARFGSILLFFPKLQTDSDYSLADHN